MSATNVEQTQLAHHMIPAIICTADSSHYLIGAEDDRGNFFNVYSRDSSQPLVADSLEQAKMLLKEKGVEKALVEMQTPYDEMVGLEAEDPARSILTL
ncbi:hypothetical protein SG34_026035 [Thalassomonas viridans]|uniref:Uncharacterized protein n=1 Tax=Thalassomonas viridans TaxID=137584 RepID=A0AAF0C6Z1_9GAMM|nr:DUF6482 family protein [Thalassomonas viridans]WDE04737.1 hypothetical protein SG34_026035 [Thalassomonas viridans]